MATALDVLTSQSFSSSLPVTSSSSYWTSPWPPTSAPSAPPDALALNATTTHPGGSTSNSNNLNVHTDLSGFSPAMSLSQSFDMTAVTAPFAPSALSSAGHAMVPTMLDSSLSSLSSASSSSSPPSPASFTSTDQYYATHGVPSNQHHHHHHQQPQPQQQQQHPLTYPRQAWPSYSLPAMNGPVLTNVHNPGGHMSMLGSMSSPMVLPGFNSGHLASMQQMYTGPSTTTSTSASPHPMGSGLASGVGPVHDRPFKCDQCPQSFNRNHDLKRHKRIHLSVKPFPCTHCDKSFSRKDALKVCPSYWILKSTSIGYLLTVIASPAG